VVSGERFRYEGYHLDLASKSLECRYTLGSWRFTEELTFEMPEETAGLPDRSSEADAATEAIDQAARGRDAAEALDQAARLTYLLAGVSYYKTAAPPVVDLGDVPTTAGERAFLRMFFVEGLGEFAYRNGIDLSGLTVTGPDRPDGRPARWNGPARWDGPAGRPLVPFGAGIDSIVTVEAVRQAHPDLSLFVVGRGGERFEAIERAVEVAGLPVVRAERRIDPAVLRSDASGFLNGHVPVTGILSAMAVLAAVLGGFDAVVMSNEWSASAATLEIGGHPVNHQWSKGLEFEAGLRDVLAGMLEPAPDYFSLLRARSELWVARRFASLQRYHRVFRSCNRAFYTDPAQRLDHWCGRCDKCCFIDLVLAPFLGPGELAGIFDGREPLATRGLEPSFRSLLGVGTAPRPFECVGDVHECRAAAVMAARRPDRAATPMVQDLAAWARDAGSPDAPTGPAGPMFERLGPDFVPPRFEPAPADEGSLSVDARAGGGGPPEHGGRR
jgi:hypothetical protein